MSFLRRFGVLLIMICSICGGLQGQSRYAYYPDTIHKKRLRSVIASESAFYVGGMAFLQFIWYRDHASVPFHFYNDNKGWMQIDKGGHAYTAYQQSVKGYDALRWAGVSHRKALWYGGSLGLILQTPIELFDGLYEGYGFSNGDMIANAVGSGLFMMQQGIWQEQIVRFKFSYTPSTYAQYHPFFLGDSELESFFLDYNGHTYWLSGNLKRITGNSRIPSWLNLAVGYSANGMLAEFKNPEFYRGEPLPQFERYRQWLLAPDVDFSKIKTRSKFLRQLFFYLNFIKVPAPALEFRAGSGVKLRGLYF